MEIVRLFAAFVVRCVSDPRMALAQAAHLRLGHRELWYVIALAAIVRVFGEVLVTGPVITMTLADREITAAPLTFALILGSGTALSIVVLHYTSRIIGGTGSFGAMLLAFAAIDVVSVVVFAAQLIVLFILPQFLGIAQVAAGAIMLVVLLNFVSISAGFDNLFKALATVVLGIVGVSFGAALFIVLIGGAAAFQS